MYELSWNVKPEIACQSMGDICRKAAWLVSSTDSILARSGQNLGFKLLLAFPHSIRSHYRGPLTVRQGVRLTHRSRSVSRSRSKSPASAKSPARSISRSRTLPFTFPNPRARSPMYSTHLAVTASSCSIWICSSLPGTLHLSACCENDRD